MVLVVGGVLTVFGFFITYLLPLALVSLNLALLFNIFMGILLGMLGGMVVLALNLQPILESLLIWVMFHTILFAENKAIPNTIKKNLVAHRLRNRKTAIAYATSLGFVIFLAVALSVEIRTLQDRQYRKQGSMIRLRSWEFDGHGDPVGIQPMARLEAWASTHPLIEDFGWVSYHLDDLSLSRAPVKISNLGRYLKDTSKVYAASPNIFELVKPGFFTPALEDPSSPFSIEEQLYTPKGFRGILLGELYKTRLALDNLRKNFAMTVLYPGQTSKITQFQPIALIKSASLFVMTYFPNQAQDSVVSFPTLLNLTGGQYQSVNEIPMRYMMFRLKDGLTDHEVDGFIQ